MQQLHRITLVQYWNFNVTSFCSTGSFKLVAKLLEKCGLGLVKYNRSDEGSVARNKQTTMEFVYKNVNVNRHLGSGSRA